MDQRIVIAIVVAGLFALVMIIVGKRKSDQRDHAAEAIERGRYTIGSITAVRCPTMFDSADKRRSDIKVHLEYRNPTTGAPHFRVHTIDKDSDAVPQGIINPVGAEPDGNGFIVLDHPIEVDVYLYSGAPSGDGLHVVFNQRLSFREYLKVE